ncbi:hypothetical protein DVH24_010017 [Malus domestica]|uniref:C-JID domain-containing protein n=1 Tax=Malus domestica TaxID=3750 RepID=A0A498JW33_MALDO|nr:hypothetical protein DVH24_010017 [Malus domestica]
MCGKSNSKWFCHQNKGSSITIKLPPDWYGADFLGFAFSIVVTDYVKIECKCNFKTNSGESHEIIYPSVIPFNKREGRLSDFHFSHIFVWYSAFALGEGANLNLSTSFYKLVTEARFELNAVKHYFSHEIAVQRMVTKCGICLLYAQDVETIKLGGTTRSQNILGCDIHTPSFTSLTPLINFCPLIFFNSSDLTAEN